LTELKAPIVVVNFKTYREVEGIRAIEIAKVCEDVSERTGTTIIVCPPTLELARVAQAVHIPVFCQHTDAKSAGANTGWITPSAVRSTGANGTLLNHSEHRLMLYDISASVNECKSAGLTTIVCADSPQTAMIIASYEPDFVAVEPPELIGGNVSVTDAKPEVVQKAVQAVHRVDSHIPVLCGAGVKNGKDLRKAMELGAKGVLLASGVIKAKDIKATLIELVTGF
jgi:triosephosphate isomerase (TIM)